MFTYPNLLGNTDFPKCSLVKTGFIMCRKQCFLFIKSLVTRNPPQLMLFLCFLTLKSLLNLNFSVLDVITPLFERLNVCSLGSPKLRAVEQPWALLLAHGSSPWSWDPYTMTRETECIKAGFAQSKKVEGAGSPLSSPAWNLVTIISDYLLLY